VGVWNKSRIQFRFKKHLSHNLIRELAEMKDHILFKMAIGTNFRLEDKQVSALNKLIDDQYGIEAIRSRYRPTYKNQRAK